MLYLIYRVQLSNELAARQSFLRLMDKNAELIDKDAELMRAEDEKKALAEDVRQLEAANEKIRKEVAISGMNEMQVVLVQVSSARLVQHSSLVVSLDAYRFLSLSFSLETLEILVTLVTLNVRLKENASDIDSNVRPEFKLDWRVIKFMLLLGSGTFGDCYKGSIAGEDVAVSFCTVRSSRAHL